MQASTIPCRSAGHPWSAPIPRTAGRAAWTAGAALLLASGTLQGQEPVRHAVDRSASHLYVVTHRAGLLSFLGHEHAIVPNRWEATLCLAPGEPTTGRGSIVIPTGSLVIDSDSARALAGLGEGPGEEDVSEMQGKLMDRLEAEAHPEIRLETTGVSAEEGGSLAVEGQLTVRGVTQDVSFDASLEEDPPGERVALEGRLEVRQSAFGIEPESVAGVVEVADEVDLHFRLVASPTGEACGPEGGPVP